MGTKRQNINIIWSYIIPTIIENLEAATELLLMTFIRVYLQIYLQSHFKKLFVCLLYFLR